MLKLRLPSGTTVGVDALRIQPTYAGQLEGSRETVSQRLLERLRGEEKMGGMQLIEPPVPLPAYRCEVTLASIERDGAPSVLSARLRVVWFTGSLVDSIAELLEPVRLAARFDTLASGIDFDDI